jgi:membrane protein YqaA with SNARE-associated domain
LQETSVGIWGLFLSAFISSTIAPGGSEAVLAYLVVAKHYQIEYLIIVASIGNTLGALTTWWLGALAAKKFPVASLLPEKKQKALEVVRRRGVWALFFSWLPIIGDALCFAGGWLKLPFLPACLVILSGKFIRYAVIGWLFA